VDEAVEEVHALHGAVGGRYVQRDRCLQVQAAVGSTPVVVLGVDRQDPLQMTGVADEDRCPGIRRA
jgi:hypothetical protein